ncbi:DUF192 domain-containing protein [Komagataeibacter sp. FNDCF1]|uniref:DUF192 domain-containing protein n=1 Tax=Komagataeibacter sp. FNDCF1 TaxID=2878681 RepID=UPI001E44B304|nr:DUF192 domain-containing protein [Komagataeibacter sp. FNDCF1]MCE2565712.1 DUF192 domain-containing protein [Komagataeibacter sp. FNDCF1]
MMSLKAGRWLALAACMAAISLPVMAAEETGEPTHAQAPLPTVALTITSASGVKHAFTVEKAMTPREQQVGEMFRPSVPANGGMIFVWPFPRQSDMWMEHTQASLDIVFIGPDNRVSSIVENAVPLSLARISSHGPVRATLELQAGITEKLGIVVGDRVDSDVLANTPAGK